jgi:N-methylhydantoinase B
MDASAVQGIDGWGSCPVSLGNLLLSQAEDAETRVPVININRDMITDTEGAGQWRGQPGSINKKQILEPTTAMTWLVSATHPLSGMCGGDDATPYATTLLVGSKDEIEVRLTAHVRMPAGAITAYTHGGGAGFGPPLARNPEAVKDDVLDEKVSVRKAREKYGVVFTGTLEEYDLAVDRAGTEALREQMKAAQSAKVAAE